MDIVAGIFLIIGSAFILLAAVGVIRFHDAFSRMHAAAKAPALGLLCAGIGTVLSIRTVPATIVVALVVVFQLIAGPVSSHLLGRSVYLRARPDLQGRDELLDIVDPQPDPNG
jgi:multicomponent Na+:H+ antiporter subunit G